MKILEIELNDIDGIPFNQDEEKAWRIIKDIFWDVLSKDENWHFFYEGEYTVIRFSEEYNNHLQRWLANRKISYLAPIEWIDSSEIVEKYKEEYTKLFHIFSMFAIFVPSNEQSKVFDRIVHPFFNHSWYKMKHQRDCIGSDTWESTMIAQNAIDRAIYNGILYQKIMTGFSGRAIVVSEKKKEII